MDTTDVSGDISGDIITHTDVTKHVIKGNIHLNCVIVKSRLPGVQSKAIVVPTFNVPLTDEQRDEIIRVERIKMAEAAAALTDVSGSSTESTT